MQFVFQFVHVECFGVLPIMLVLQGITNCVWSTHSALSPVVVFKHETSWLFWIKHTLLIEPHSHHMCVHNWTTHPALRMKTGQGWDHSQTPPWCSKVCRYVHVLSCKGCVWGGFIPCAAGQWGHHCWHCLYYTHRSECVCIKLGETFCCRSFFFLAAY